MCERKGIRDKEMSRAVSMGLYRRGPAVPPSLTPLSDIHLFNALKYSIHQDELTILPHSLCKGFVWFQEKQRSFL
jgi:hypothetical protein